MPRITRIAKQERRDRYNVFVDGKFFTALSDVLLSESGIREGDELSPGQLEPFIVRDAAGKVLNQALRYLSRRPHSEHELRLKLARPGGRREGAEPELIDEAFARLREIGYLDDRAFAEQWVAERGGQRGRRLLQAELRRKGIASNIVDEALAGAGSDDLAAATALATKRAVRLSGQSPEATKQKLIRYLAGRGYDYDLSRRAVESLATPTRN